MKKIKDITITIHFGLQRFKVFKFNRKTLLIILAINSIFIISSVVFSFAYITQFGKNYLLRKELKTMETRLLKD